MQDMQEELDLKHEAMNLLDRYLPMDLIDENAVKLLSDESFQGAISQVILSKIDVAVSDSSFPRNFNKAFWNEQFSNRVISYIYWGTSEQ